MNDLIAALVRLLLLSIALVVGALFFVFFFFLVLAFALVWGVRRLWARMTDKPVAPWVFQFNPKAGFQKAYSSVCSKAPQARPGSRATGAAGRIADAADVTDVTPKAVSGGPRGI